jgi:hypothetical protein
MSGEEEECATVEGVVQALFGGVTTKSELLQRLRKVVRRTPRGLYVVKTILGEFTMSTRRLHDYLGKTYLKYVNDDVLTQNLAEIIEKIKKELNFYP